MRYKKKSEEINSNRYSRTVSVIVLLTESTRTTTIIIIIIPIYTSVARGGAPFSPRDAKSEIDQLPDQTFGFHITPPMIRKPEV